MSNQPTCKVVVSKGFLTVLGIASERAGKKTLEAVKTDLQQSQTMPFKKGDMQNTQTQVDDEVVNGAISLRTIAEQANRLYYHPEYNFTKTENPDAGAYWLETYENGEKMDFIPEVYELFLKEELKNLL